MPKESNPSDRVYDNWIAEPGALTLTSRDWEAFLTALDDDRPRPELLAAVRRYRDRRKSDSDRVFEANPRGEGVLSDR